MAEPEIITRPACIAAALAQIDEKRAYVESMQRVAQIAEEVMGGFASLPEATVRIGWDGGSIQGVLVMVGGYGERALKEVRIMFPILKEFSRRGFRRDGEPKDYPEIGRRTWKLREAIDSTPILLSAFLSTPNLVAEGASCRYEQTGTKEVPVYKLVCDPESEEASR